MEATTPEVVGLIRVTIYCITLLIALAMILALGRKVGSSGLKEACVSVGLGRIFSITATLKGEAVAAPLVPSDHLDERSARQEPVLLRGSTRADEPSGEVSTHLVE